MTDTDEVELTKKQGDDAPAAAPEETMAYAKHSFPGFLPYDKRGCTDCLCTIIFIFFFAVWIGMLIVGILYGRPEVITHSTDYAGNVCGKYLGYGLDAATGALTNTQNSWELGTAPHGDITASNLGIFPRLVDDMERMVTITPEGKFKYPTSFDDISVTSYCSKQCPKKGDVYCTYEFAYEQDDASTNKNSGWQTSPLTGNAAEMVKKNLAFTAHLTRQQVGSGEAGQHLLRAACAGAGPLCEKVFASCDNTIMSTTKVLGRCVPVVKKDENSIMERCADPVGLANVTVACAALIKTDPRKAWVECIEDPDNANHYQKAIFTPYLRPGSTDYELDPKDKQKCRRVETKSNNIAESIPQASMLTEMMKKAQSFSKYVQDVQTAWLVVLMCGMLFAVVMGFLFLFVIRMLAMCFVWTTIFLLQICLFAAAFMCLARGGVVPDAITSQVLSVAQVSVDVGTDSNHELYYKIAGGIFLFLAILFFALIIAVRKAIMDSIKIIKISANAVSKNFTIILWPFVSIILIGGFSVLFIVIGCLLMASVTPKEAGWTAADNVTVTGGNMTGAFLDVRKYQSQDTLKYAALFDLFMWLWTTELVQAIGVFVIGGTVSNWYFTPKGQAAEPTGNKKFCARCQEGGVSGALCITIRKHFGTAAFGALVIAIIQMIRLGVAYLMEQLNKGGEGRIIKCIKCCVNCCLGCVEKCAKYLSKNAYIYTSVHGTSFCFSAYKSFTIIWNNLMRFGATGLSSALVMLFGKLFMCFASVVACYLWLSTSTTTYANFQSDAYIDAKGSIFVCAIVGLLAFITAEIFFNVYEITSDTILLSYCIDIEKGGEAFKDKLGEDFKPKKGPDDEHRDEIDGNSEHKVCCFK